VAWLKAVTQNFLENRITKLLYRHKPKGRKCSTKIKQTFNPCNRHRPKP